jgi:hypothetical protein
VHRLDWCGGAFERRLRACRRWQRFGFLRKERLDHFGRVEAHFARVGADEAADEDATRHFVEFVVLDRAQDVDLDLGRRGQLRDLQATQRPGSSGQCRHPRRGGRAISLPRCGADHCSGGGAQDREISNGTSGTSSRASIPLFQTSTRRLTECGEADGMW